LELFIIAVREFSFGKQVIDIIQGTLGSKGESLAILHNRHVTLGHAEKVILHV